MQNANKSKQQKIQFDWAKTTKRFIQHCTNNPILAAQTEWNCNKTKQRKKLTHRSILLQKLPQQLFIIYIVIASIRGSFNRDTKYAWQIESRSHKLKIEIFRCCCASLRHYSEQFNDAHQRNVCISTLKITIAAIPSAIWLCCGMAANNAYFSVALMSRTAMRRWEFHFSPK